MGRELPDGDWDAHISFTGEFKRKADSVWLGLRDDAKNYLAARFWSSRNSLTTCQGAGLNILKRSGGSDPTRFETPVLECNSLPQEDFESWRAQLASTPAMMTLSKRGRSYSASIEVPMPGGGTETFTTDTLTSLRAPGHLALTAGTWEDIDGELLLQVDSVEIEAVEVP